MVWRVLSSQQGIQHLPTSVLVSSWELGRFEKIANVSIRICGSYTFWHMAPFNSAEALFRCSTSKHLRHSCYHNGAFDFPCNCHFNFSRNHHFGCRVLCLEGGHLEFWESRPLILQGWTVGLWALNHLNLVRWIRSWDVIPTFNSQATYAEAVG